MNIFMFVNYTPSDQSLGITHKIGAEISSLRHLGHKVYYTAYEEDGVYVYDNDDEIAYKKSYKLNNEFYIRTYRYFLLVKTALEYFAKGTKHFEVFYGRLLAPSKRYLSLLRAFKEDNCKIILEAHAYFPGIKFQSLKGKYVSYMLEKNGPKLSKLVDRILTEGHIDEFYGIPEVCEAKIGVNTNAISPHRYCGSKEELNCISVANETTYHAYDRIIKSLSQYYKRGGNPHNIYLHLVGTVSEKTKKLIEQEGLGDKVIVYGKKYGDELAQIYDKCNLGLGPFGQHRIGGKKDTGLKTKEYFAKGLPYIFSGEEPSVPMNYPYLLRFSSDESYIDFNRTWEFYCSFRDNDQVVTEMRNYALENYSWDSIMEKAISW